MLKTLNATYKLIKAFNVNIKKQVYYAVLHVYLRDNKNNFTYRII